MFSVAAFAEYSLLEPCEAQMKKEVCLKGMGQALTQIRESSSDVSTLACWHAAAL